MSRNNTSSNNKTLSIYHYDENIRQKHSVIAGLDEAGRGPLAGPVVASAVILPAGLIIEGLRDSKKIAEKERKRIFWEIAQHADGIGVGIVDAETIDRINILEATKCAMKEAVEDLEKKPGYLLIDSVKLSGVDIEQSSMIKGESVSASIAAASIIAKTVRDDIMIAYHEIYPDYNFKGHKGYSTKEHMELIGLYGPCPIHRMSFKRVKDDQLIINYK